MPNSKVEGKYATLMLLSQIASDFLHICCPINLMGSVRLVAARFHQRLSVNPPMVHLGCLASYWSVPVLLLLLVFVL